MFSITIEQELSTGKKKVFVRYFPDINSAIAYKNYISNKKNYAIVKIEKVN